MKRTLLVVLVTVLVMATSTVVWAQRFSKMPTAAQWIDDIVLAAVDRVLSTLPADAYQIEAPAAKRQIDAGAVVVIDVRDAANRTPSPVIGALQIPLKDLTKRIAALPTDLDTPILVYCQNGLRGAMAMTALRTMGYTNVQNLRGGLDAWGAGTVAVKH